MYGGGGRYGIWGVDPYGPDLMDKALRTSQGLGQNQLQGYQQQGLGLQNMQRQSDLAYQPQMRQQQQALNQAQIAHLRAQAEATNRTKDPAYQFKEIMRSYGSAADKSPEKMYYGSLLNQMMMGADGGGGGMGMQVPGMGGTGQPGAAGAMGMGAPQGQNGAIVNPGTISARSKRGMEYTVPNPDGTVTTYASPTMAAETQSQNRLSAEQEAKVLLDPVIKGIKPYQGDIFERGPAFIKDLFKSKMGNKEATERLGGYARALSLRPEAAATVGRMATGGGQVGIEMMNELSKAQARNIPGEFLNSFLPAAALQKSNEQYLPTQSAGVTASVNQVRNNFPMGMEQAPQYAQGSGQSVFRFTGDNTRDAAMLTQMYSPQPQGQPQGKAEPQSGWSGDKYTHSNGKSYTRAELEKIAKGGK